MMMMSEPEQRSLSHNTPRTNMSALIITLKVRQWDAAITDCWNHTLYQPFTEGTNHAVQWEGLRTQSARDKLTV